MNIVTYIHALILKQNLITPHSTIIVGLSGGPDSVFLLHVLNKLKQELKLTLIAAHVDHGWRTESAEDAQFCKTLAEQLEIPCIIAHAQDIMLIKKANGSKEELGRLLRRQFFEELATKYNAQHIALAHHQDDQAETFFVRLLRGSGLTGLAGMHVCERLYIRPLLYITKQEILAYLHENNIPYRIDHTNTDQTFLRNKIRHTVIPALKNCDARFEKSFVRTHAHLQQAADFIEQQAQIALENCTLKNSENEKSIENRQLIIEKFNTLHPFLQHKVLELWLCEHKIPFTPSQALFAEIMRFLDNKKGASHNLFNDWQLVKNKGNIILKKIHYLCEIQGESTM
ncbi:MAG: tRNA lysidine(34) synthetase TilS [Candidatus Babeliaceae bacterium]